MAAVAKPRRMSSAWLNRLLVLAGVGVVLAAAVQAYMALERIPVQRISVTGELEHTRSEVVQEMVQPALSGGFLNADLQLIRQELEALPWIYEGNVRRKWPNALEIHVIEQLPIARWGRRVSSITRARCSTRTALSSGSRCLCCRARGRCRRWWRTTSD